MFKTNNDKWCYKAIPLVQIFLALIFLIYGYCYNSDHIDNVHNTDINKVFSLTYCH